MLSAFPFLGFLPPQKSCAGQSRDFHRPAHPHPPGPSFTDADGDIEFQPVRRRRHRAHANASPIAHRTMSERGNFRGGRGGRGDRGGRGGGADRGGRGGGQAGGGERKKENILDLTKYMDKEITVKFNGGREGMWDLGCRLCEYGPFADLGQSPEP